LLAVRRARLLIVVALLLLALRLRIHARSCPTLMAIAEFSPYSRQKPKQERAHP
jgi:hypothetical protein